VNTLRADFWRTIQRVFWRLLFMCIARGIILNLVMELHCNGAIMLPASLKRYGANAFLRKTLDSAAIDSAAIT
jgi:hypothetical protein